MFFAQHVTSLANPTGYQATLMELTQNLQFILAELESVDLFAVWYRLQTIIKMD